MIRATSAFAKDGLGEPRRLQPISQKAGAVPDRPKAALMACEQSPDQRNSIVCNGSTEM